MRNFALLCFVVGCSAELADPGLPGGAIQQTPTDLGGTAQGTFPQSTTDQGQQGTTGGSRTNNTGADSDSDGLPDSLEAQLGSNPNAADTDGDGYDDGDEYYGNTDPTDSNDKPYAAGWPIDACRDQINSTGNQIGQITSDFSLLSQTGEQVSLHDFCGKEVLLVTSAMWCGPCQAEAPQLQALYNDYKDEGLIIITLLGEDEYGNSPSRQKLQEWADAFGLQHPVLADTNFDVTARFLASSSFSIPTMHLLGEGAEVLVRDSWISDSTVISNLP